MKKTTKLWFMLAIAGITALSSCKKDEEEPVVPPTVDECASATLPVATGDATINVANYSSTTIEVEAGNILALAVQVTKGSSRTKKLRLFTSDCINILGTEEDLSDQPKGGANGIDLRNTDDVQIRNVNYAIPTGMDPIYLTIQIDEGGGNTNYQQLTLNASGSGLVTLTENVELGGNSNTTAGPNADGASRMATSTGLTYSACNAAANIDYIDMTYAVNKTAPYPMYLCSNPARFAAPVSLVTSIASCGDDGDLSTAGGRPSYFVSYTGVIPI